VYDIATGRSGESDMVTLFLRTELPAARSRDDRGAHRVVTDPNLDDDAENEARLRPLTQHRGYHPRRAVRGLPGRRPLAVDGAHTGRARRGTAKT